MPPNTNHCMVKRRQRDPACTPKRSAAAEKFFAMRELFVMEFLPHCSLDTIMALAKTGQHARDLIKTFFACNIRLLVAFYIGEANLSSFFNVLEVSGSAIAGSVASATLSAPYRHMWKPNNLNINVPRGFTVVWQQYFHNIGFAPKLQTGPNINSNGVDRRYGHTTLSYTVYESFPSKFSIGLAESIDNSTFTPLIGATTTYAMSMITCSDYFVTYPALTAQNRALEGWFPTDVQRAITINKRGIRSSFSTTSWERPCGISCPIVWREVRGLRGVGVFRWGGNNNQYADGIATVGIPTSDTRSKWRLGDACNNRNCPYYRACFYDDIMV